MSIRIYNTLTKNKDVLAPLSDRRVNLFVCGPTVYASSHIGHARTYVFFDVVAKYLRAHDYGVRYLQNITDVDDKIIHRAQEIGSDPLALAAEETKKYLDDMATLKVTAVNTYARASEYIENIQSQIQRLIDGGHAYPSHGSVYYDVSTFPDFGKLSRQHLESLHKAARTEDDPNKRHAHDFVLWRGRKKESGEPIWNSPWGSGRPGWHIEDTAITEKEFGPQYDIHGGGIELVFPHHEAEIAQMEGISGKRPLARIWMHTGWVTVKGEKMSKSLGNFLTIEEIFKKGFSPEALRYLLLKTHYRSPLEYSDTALLAAELHMQTIKRTRALLKLLDEKNLYGTAKTVLSDDGPANPHSAMRAAMDDDFNTSVALGNVDGYMSHLNALLSRNNLISKDDIEKIFSLFRDIEHIFGIIPPEKHIPASIQEKVKKREALRAEKNWNAVNILKEEIMSAGFDIDDMDPYGSLVWDASKYNHLKERLP